MLYFDMTGWFEVDKQPGPVTERHCLLDQAHSVQILGWNSDGALC